MMIKWIRKKLRKLVYGSVILCDTCKYNYRTSCVNPDRPNATDCDEYAR
ncbi:MAG TPA: hypothetical protein VM223_28935 [Planctomycetota bacterium]|nr:hypothetical protein [Planctomycetota bacterium]